MKGLALLSGPTAPPTTLSPAKGSSMVSNKQYFINLGSCNKLVKLVKLTDEKFKLFEFEAKVGLNASQSHSTFFCLFEETNQRFFVWLGDVTIDKFNKSTFLNLVNFATEHGALKMVLIQSRDHCQKGNSSHP